MTRLIYQKLRGIWQTAANDVASGKITALQSVTISLITEDLAQYGTACTFDETMAGWFKHLGLDVRKYEECYIIHLQ